MVAPINPKAALYFVGRRGGRLTEVEMSLTSLVDRAPTFMAPREPAYSMEGRTGFRHDFLFVILTELPAAITQTRGPYTCLKELQPGIPKSIGSVGLRFCCGKFCKNDGD